MLRLSRDFPAALNARSFKCLLSTPARLLAASLLVLIVVAMSGCGGSGLTASPAPDQSARAETSDMSIDTDGSSGATVAFHGEAGETVLYVEVADTAGSRSRGLMGRSHLDQDHGMIFVWDAPVRSGFWMKDTLIPLSIAFLGANGVIIDIQDMEPQTLETHTPDSEYLYAIEVNQGYFGAHAIKVGDRADFSGI